MDRFTVCMWTQKKHLTLKRSFLVFFLLFDQSLKGLKNLMSDCYDNFECLFNVVLCEFVCFKKKMNREVFDYLYM